MKKQNYQLLSNWLYKTLADNPEFLTKVKEPKELYFNLYVIWLNDVQLAMKEMAKDVLKTGILDPHK
jgi:hypothetical protein